MIGLGITTLNRPDYYTRMIDSVVEQLHDILDYVVVVNDGTDEPTLRAGYSNGDGKVMANFPNYIRYNARPSGYCAAKNMCLQHMLDAGCDWLFLADDDVIINSPSAVSGYIAAMFGHRLGHLSFHAPVASTRGGWNAAPMETERLITTWPNHSGQWLAYSRKALETCGLFDARLQNTWEHVEHTTRLGLAGFGYNGNGAYDATGSEEWIHEIPEAVTHSAIDYAPERYEEGKVLWNEFHPDSYKVVWG